MSTVNSQVKYLVVGIDNTSGSFVYITGDNDKILDSAKTDYSPYDVVQNSAVPPTTDQKPNENMQYVKIKVMKSSTKPVTAPTDKNPYFELNKNWYTLLLDQFVNPLETSGVVDKSWFADYGLEKNPFDIFKRFVYTNLVELNLKYLLNLSSDDSDFRTAFPELEINKNGTLDQIQNALVQPFFAVKTILDMKSAKEEMIDGKKVVINGYFVNGRDRYGYPNVMGDKSHFISALQLLYDIRLYCEECLIPEQNLSVLHQHIKNRIYFLQEGDPDGNLMDFENKLKSVFRIGEGKRNFRDECWTFLSSFLNKESIELGRDIGTVAYDKNMLIVDSNQLVSKDKGFELIGQICKLKDVDQFIYINYKENLIFNDIEVRKLTEDQRLAQWSEDQRVSLFRKKGQTFRDRLKSKFFITDEDINATIKGNQTLIFVDRFVKKDPVENNKCIDLFMRQYLSDSSRRELENILKTPFTGETYRHGICNYNGEISFFIAAMQLLYDCSLRRSSIDFNRQTAGNTAAIRVFEFQLLNQEYCLGRIFDNIHVGTEKIYSPLDTFVKIPNGGGKENAFYNYMICLNFIINKAQFKINWFPKEIQNFPGENSKGLSQIGQVAANAVDEEKAKFETHSDYKNKIISNNYFYKGFAEKRGVEADLKYILANNCVKVIHKIMAVLLTGFNVFVDFQDDLRSQQIKWGTLDPTNFVIMIGRLPTKKVSIPNPPKNASNQSENASSSPENASSSPENASSSSTSSTSSKPPENASLLTKVKEKFFTNSKTDDSSNSKTSNSSSDAPTDAPADAPTDAPANPQPMPSQQNWLKVTTNDEHEIIGFYEQNKDDTYTKINDTIKLRKDGENWIISKNNTETVINKEGEKYFITDNAKKIFINFEETGAPYLPGSADIQSDNIDYYDLPPNYSIKGTSYTVVGTIYKSIHHDYYYNYYDHEHNTLLSDCNAKYNVQAMNIDSFTVNKEMFPFIRLYKKNGFVPPDKKDLIYQDVITQIKSGQI